MRPQPGWMTGHFQRTGGRPIKRASTRRGVIVGCVVSAKVLELPARVRRDRAARELREGVIGVLKAMPPCSASSISKRNRQARRGPVTIERAAPLPN